MRLGVDPEPGPKRMGLGTSSADSYSARQIRCKTLPFQSNRYIAEVFWIGIQRNDEEVPELGRKRQMAVVGQ